MIINNLIRLLSFIIFKKFVKYLNLMTKTEIAKKTKQKWVIIE